MNTQDELEQAFAEIDKGTFVRHSTECDGWSSYGPRRKQVIPTTSTMRLSVPTGAPADLRTTTATNHRTHHGGAASRSAPSTTSDGTALDPCMRWSRAA